MRMVAQSVVPARQSYLHMGYLAAAQMNNLILLCASVLIALLILYYQVQHKTRKGYIAVTIILALAALVFCVNGYYLEGDRLDARMRSMRFRALIMQKQSEHEAIPATMGEMRAKWGLTKEQTQDLWGRDLRVRGLRVYRGQVSYEVRSAGRDGRFGTSDDSYWGR